MDTLKQAIEILAKKISDKTTPDEALKFTQAANNLANTLATLKHAETIKSS